MLMFLDIDGVLVPARSWKSPELHSDGFAKFSEQAVNVLQRFISADTTVMLTTSHKSQYSIDTWKCIFSERGLSINNLASLSTDSSAMSRKDEILTWFSSNGFSESFIILDDDTSLNDLPAYMKERLVLTSPLIGLTEKHSAAITDLFNSAPVKSRLSCAT